jgi:hypothetical protein
MDQPLKKPRTHYCPSAPADAEGAQIFGVVVDAGDRTEVAYLAEPLPLDETSAGLAEGLEPSEVFRLTSPCFESRCAHHHAARCTLGDDIHQHAPVVADALPPCSIRNHCRWFAEQGPAVCQRCPAIITSTPSTASAPSGAFEPSNKLYRRLKLVP